jgi:quercetin dioxygenase-like cupin family protein
MIEVQAVSLEAFGSHGVTINHPIDPACDRGAPAILRSGGATQVVTALLEPGGTIGRHPATRPQLLMVISGTLQITGDDGQVLELAAGQAVLFQSGDQHESVASTAVTLAIMEFDSSAQ